MVAVGIAVRVIVRVPVIVAVPVIVIVFVVDMLHAFGDRHRGGRLRVQHLAEEQHQGRSTEREEWDQPDEI